MRNDNAVSWHAAHEEKINSPIKKTTENTCNKFRSYSSIRELNQTKNVFREPTPAKQAMLKFKLSQLQTRELP